jgi:hypothetical protein
MTGLIERAASVFVEPSARPEPPANSAFHAASRAAVLGAAHIAVPVAAALAGGLRERERAAGAVLIAWPATEAPRPALGTPAAARLVAGLQARGLEAVARGRLAWVAVADVGLARRALNSVAVPAVLAVTGPRCAASDELLAEQDHIILVASPEDDSRLTELARAGLAEYGIPVTVRGPLTAPGAHTTALAGWGRLRLPA